MLQLSERHDGAIFSPNWSTARLAVTLFAKEEEPGFDLDLTGGWSCGEALDSWLGDPIHVSEVFVPSFIPWTNVSIQIVNEGDV